MNDSALKITAGDERIKLSDLFSREEISELTTRSNWSGAWAVSSTWVIVGLTFAGAGLALTLLPLPAALVVCVLATIILAGRQLCLAIINHDAGHGTLFESKWANRFFGDWFAARLIGNDYDKQGLDVAFVERMTAHLMTLWNKASPQAQLALTVGTEHLTAVLGHALMESDYIRDQLKDEQMLRMWLWHAIEENEHKSVAFDALKEINPSYALRISAYVFMLSCGIPLVLGCQTRQMFKDGHGLNFTSWKKGLAIIFSRQGLLTGQVGRLLDYLNPILIPMTMIRWR